MQSMNLELKWGYCRRCSDKITRLPNGDIDILALDEMVFAAQGSLAQDSTPFERLAGIPVLRDMG